MWPIDRWQPGGEERGATYMSVSVPCVDRGDGARDDPPCMCGRALHDMWTTRACAIAPMGECHVPSPLCAMPEKHQPPRSPVPPLTARGSITQTQKNTDLRVVVPLIGGRRLGLVFFEELFCCSQSIKARTHASSYPRKVVIPAAVFFGGRTAIPSQAWQRSFPGTHRGPCADDGYDVASRPITCRR